MNSIAKRYDFRIGIIEANFGEAFARYADQNLAGWVLDRLSDERPAAKHGPLGFGPGLRCLLLLQARVGRYRGGAARARRIRSSGRASGRGPALMKRRQEGALRSAIMRQTKALAESGPQPDAWMRLVLQSMSPEELRKELAAGKLSSDERRWMVAELLTRNAV